MTEAHWSEVEKVLLYIADARVRTTKAKSRLEHDAAPAHALEAIAAAEEELAELHRRLKQGTYFSVADDSLKLAV